MFLMKHFPLNYQNAYGGPLKYIEKKEKQSHRGFLYRIRYDSFHLHCKSNVSQNFFWLIASGKEIFRNGHFRISYFNIDA